MIQLPEAAYSRISFQAATEGTYSLCGRVIANMPGTPKSSATDEPSANAERKASSKVTATTFIGLLCGRIFLPDLNFFSPVTP